MKLAQVRSRLDEPTAARLDEGAYAEVAATLEAAGEHEAAASLWEMTWDFDRACAEYLRAMLPVHALRCALESSDPARADEVITALAGAPESDRDEAVALLRRRKRSNLVASLLSRTSADPERLSDAMAASGDELGAARKLAEAGRVAEALSRLMPLDPERGPLEAVALAASLSWRAGDAQRAAGLSQTVLRRGGARSLARSVLGPALTALGHGLAADIARGTAADLADTDDDVAASPPPGRYIVRKLARHILVGRAVEGFDRVTQQEVEIHDLLADLDAFEGTARQARAVVADFVDYAAAAAQVGHPALRSILWSDRAAGLLVLSRGSAQTLRGLIRPPGMLGDTLHVRAMLLFLLEGLAQAHERGFVHGAILPSLIVFDAAERPLLNPFGMHLLAGLVATRTGSLEELFTVTAPEVQEGAVPSPAADIFAVGKVYAALLSGSLPPDEARIPADARAIIESMTALRPEDRPTAREAATALRVPRSLTHRLASGRHSTLEAATVPTPPSPAPSLQHVKIEAHPSWTETALTEICRCADPYLQPVLDRRDRSFFLAPWPEGCATFEETTARSSLLSGELQQALERLPEEARAAIEARLLPCSVVRTPNGARMLALDDLLSRHGSSD